jgi:hypothetical protein
MISGFQAMVESALDEWRILDMLAVISRAALNIDLLVGDLGTIPAQRATIIQS